MVAAGVALATPILLAALGELLVERAGVLNIGIEGMMLSGAFAAAVAAHASGSSTMGLAAAAAAGLLLSALFALTVLALAADQILVGTAINLLALGVTGAFYRPLAADAGGLLLLPTLPILRVPGVSDLPWVGSTLFAQNLVVYFGLVLTPLLSMLLHHSGLGLRLRAIGDHPLAATSLGYSVRAYRWTAILCGGLLAGVAGATLTLAATNTFVEGITGGRGFIALAVVVLGRWSPWGVLVGALFFGSASALQFQLQAAALDVPHQFFLMLPYLLTLVVLASFSGRIAAPRALASGRSS
jgi:ABC-type uncharacterized transport system permease subunit